MTAFSSRGIATTLISLALLAVGFGGGMANTAAAAANGCKKVEGQVVVEPVNDPTLCSSPWGCGTGTIKGDIKGSFEVVTTSFSNSIDSEQTGVVFTTADTVFTTSDGTLKSKDASTVRLPSGSAEGAGGYAEVITIVGGTERYAGATGTLMATGGFTSTGARGTYSGTICLP